MTSKRPKLLFIAYYYPPAGGAALPGSQRTVKFLRYVETFDCYVLTLKESCYREYIDLNFNQPIPVHSELIYRTGRFDIFQILLSVRTFFKKKFSNFCHSQLHEDSSSSVKNSICSDLNEKSTFQHLKDFIYNLIYFPDDAAPWLIPAVFKGRNIVKKKKIDIIFATGMPWTSLFLGYVLHKLTGKPLVVDFRDPWVGNPFHVSKGWFFDKLMGFLERRIVQSAAIVSANTEPLREDFLLRYPQLNDKKFVVLPNGFDLSDFSDLGQAPPPSHRLYLAHAGSLYGRRDPLPLLQALRLLGDSDKDLAACCHFTQMGYIEAEYDFHKSYNDLTDKGIIEDAGLFSYSECLQKLAQSDIAVIIQPATKIQIPSKLYDYMAMNKYILAITPLDGIMAKIMRQYHLGDVFDPSDIDGLQKKIKDLIHEKKQTGKISVSYQNVDEFNVETITARLEQLIRNTLS